MAGSSNTAHPSERAEKIAGYTVLAVLGYGAHSTIYAVQAPKDTQVYALKRVVRKEPSDQKFLDQAINEYNIASRLDHPAIRKCYKKKRRGGLLGPAELLLIMELIDGRNLVQQRPATLMELVRVFLTVADALGAMHKAGYVHADMKPNNILLTDDGTIKIIDFGQSCRIGTVKSRIQGTPDYIAPEQVKRRALTAKTDMFNLGATMYWSVTDNHIPTLVPKGDGEIGLKDSAKLREPEEFNPDLPPSLTKLIMHCLKSKPDFRPESMSEVKSRLDLVMRKLDRDQPVVREEPVQDDNGQPMPRPRPRPHR